MAKGGAFERKISKLLSLWLSEGKEDDYFWRTGGSGARQTIRKKKTAGADGDLLSTNANENANFFIGKISVECKHYKNINLWAFITETKFGLRSFWDQAVRQAEMACKEPVVIVRQNNMPILLIACNNLHFALRKSGIRAKIIGELSGETVGVYDLENSIMKFNPLYFMKAFKELYE